MKLKMIFLLLLAGFCGATSAFAASAQDRAVVIGQPTIFWRNNRWEMWQDGKWISWTEACERQRDRDRNARVAGRDPSGLGQPNVAIGQSTIGIGKPNMAIGQNNFEIGPNNFGIGRPNAGIGRRNVELGQTTI